MFVGAVDAGTGISLEDVEVGIGIGTYAWERKKRPVVLRRLASRAIFKDVDACWTRWLIQR